MEKDSEQVDVAVVKPGEFVSRVVFSHDECVTAGHGAYLPWRISLYGQ